MTVRRDIQKLEEQGLVIQHGGGVKGTMRIFDEPSHEQKAMMQSEEKLRIGQKASELVPPRSCIYLDAGTTTLALGKQFVGRDDLTIVTNDLVVAQCLVTSSQNNVIMVGGQIRNSNLSTVGHLAVYTLKALSIDLAFLSASSFDERGITTPDPDKVVVKQEVARISAQRILVCDATKYGQVGTYIAVPMTEINTIITDNRLTPSNQRQLIKTGVNLIMV